MKLKIDKNIMTRFILVLLTLSPSILFAQKTKKIEDKDNNEVYYLLKSDKITKHGEYLKLSANKDTLIKGFYKNGVMDSAWEYYSSKGLLKKGLYKNGQRDGTWEIYSYGGKLVKKYDYTNKQLTYARKTGSDDENENEEPNNHPPIFLAGSEIAFIGEHLKYPPVAIENGITGKVIIQFTVFKDGETGNIRVKEGPGWGLKDEALRVVKLMSDYWLPAFTNGEAVDFEYEFPVTFSLKD
jgi:TonB family protein